MARIRTLKPEFWSDEKLSLLDPLTRLVYLGLISMADDAGRLVDNLKAVDGMLFPNTDDTSDNALETLARLSRILRYVAPSGQHLIQIVAWSRHQVVAHPSRYVLPAPTPEDYAQVQAAQDVSKSLAQASRGVHESRMRASRDAHDSTLDHGPRTKDLSSATSAEPKPRSRKSDPKYQHYPTDVCTQLYDTYRRTRGPIDYATFRRETAVLFPTHYTPAELTGALEAWGEWVAALPPKESRWQRPSTWATDIDRWVRLGAMPVVDLNGVTERGYLAVGASA